jgi:MscS family membrane protein
MKFLNQQFFGLPAEHYVRFAVILAIGFFFKGFISRFLSKYVFKLFAREKEGDHSDSFALHIRRPFSNFIFTVFAYVATMQLAPMLDDIFLFGKKVKGIDNEILEDAAKAIVAKKFTLLDLIERIFFFVQIFTFTNLLVKTLSFIFKSLAESAHERKDKERQQLLPLLRDVIRVVIWSCMIFVILGVVFKVNVAALIAGLGVGGIAIAFALKDSLENLLSSFMILLDKPFVIGDYIKIAGVEGNVERVGFRSTLIRTPDKTLVSMPNRNLITNNLENFSERGAKRVKMVIGAEYGLSVEQLQSIVKEIVHRIEQHPNTMGKPTVNVDNFGNSAIDINVAYFVKLGVGASFESIKEEINYEIYEVMYTLGTGFPYPTQTNIEGTAFDNVSKKQSE